jgi:predicted transcriptional regulator
VTPHRGVVRRGIALLVNSFIHTHGSKKTYTITEAAKKLGITRQAVHKAINNGAISARKVEVVKSEWEHPADALREHS